MLRRVGEVTERRSGSVVGCGAGHRRISTTIDDATFDAIKAFALGERISISAAASEILKAATKESMR